MPPLAGGVSFPPELRQTPVALEVRMSDGIAELPPVWLLDVDGVINAISERGDCATWPADQWRRHEVTHLNGTTWPILAAEPVLDFLREVHHAGAAELRWHTTWQNSAQHRLAPALGLPDWPVAGSPEFTDQHDSGYGFAAQVRRTWWKLGAVERVIREEGRRLLWTDDDIRYGGDEELERVLSAPGVLAVSPTPTTGLDRGDLASIADFLNLGRHPTTT